MPEPWQLESFEAQVRTAILARLPQPRPRSVWQLRLRLVEEARRRRPPRRRSSHRFAFAMGIATSLIVFGVLAISPRAAAAMRHVLGFIPGLGLVEQQTSWYTLAEPVSQSRGGVVLTVEAASSDLNRTVVLVKVDGLLPPLGAPSTGSPDCEGSPQLVASGRTMTGVGQRQEVWDSGYTYRLVFPAMPTGVTQAELHIPCLLQIIPGAWPQDWVIPFTFWAGAGQQVESAYEPRLAIQEGATALPFIEPTGTNAAAPTHDAKNSMLLEVFGISPKLESVVQHSDGILLFGMITWSGSAIPANGIVLPTAVSLSGANGEEIHIEPTAADQVPGPGSHQTAWAFHAPGGEFPEPLTLTFHGFLVDLPAKSDFDVAIDPDFQPGQSWQVDHRINIGAFDVRIVTAELNPGDTSTSRLSLTLDSDSNVVGALVFDRDHPEPNGGGGGGIPKAGRPFTVTLSLPAGHPSTAHLSIGRITILIDETSSITWTEPTP